AEIAATLGADGALDALPFMPEMLRHCGQRVRVSKRAHKTCDTIHQTGNRRVSRAVHLDDLRCDGTAHGGCQAGCLLFWKEAWLKRAQSTAGVKGGGSTKPVTTETATSPQTTIVSMAVSRMEGNETVYSCQATQLPYATKDLTWWNPAQYFEDISSGNVSFVRLVQGFVYAGYYWLSQSGLGLGRPMRWLYNRLAPLWRGSLFPRTAGAIPAG